MLGIVCSCIYIQVSEGDMGGWVLKVFVINGKCVKVYVMLQKVEVWIKIF